MSWRGIQGHHNFQFKWKVFTFDRQSRRKGSFQVKLSMSHLNSGRRRSEPVIGIEAVTDFPRPNSGKGDKVNSSPKSSHRPNVELSISCIGFRIQTQTKFVLWNMETNNCNDSRLTLDYLQNFHGCQFGDF